MSTLTEIVKWSEKYQKSMPKSCIYCDNPEHFGLMPTILNPDLPFKGYHIEKEEGRTSQGTTRIKCKNEKTNN